MNPIIFNTALTLAILSFSVHSTDVIPKGGDAIRLQSIEYRDTVSSGSERVWDLSGYAPDGEIKLKLEQEKDSIITCALRGTRYRFALQGDTLIDAGFENKLSDMYFSQGEILLIFPLSQTFSTDGIIDGRGRYADRYIHEMTGSYHSYCDARGLLITPEGDTIRNVTRVVTTRTTVSRYQPNDSMSRAENVPSLPVTLVTSRLYAPGYRYPLLLGKMVKPGETAYAYYISPDEQESLSDSDNEEIRALMAGKSFLVPKPDARSGTDGMTKTFKHTFTQDKYKQSVTVSCEAGGPVKVRLLLTNAVGVVYESRTLECADGAPCTATFSYGALPRHMTYCIVIQTDTEQFTEKFYH